ncbi:hypothetical protein DFH09DRAFT_1192826 [Mycena vulgaris]|nr:hypothetical protein DFH09DRAFT_1192826 [Mycena vulgaris]
MSVTLAGSSPRAAEPRSATLDASQHVLVLHPGYTPPRTLFLLVAFPTSSGQYGVPFSDGSLRDLHNTIVTAPVDEAHLVPPGEYTYHVASEPRYPICTSFRAWTPPRTVPSHWAFGVMGAQELPPYSSPSTFSDVVRASDGRCAVTGAISRLHNSYLVPSTEEQWWEFWGMSGITRNLQGIHSPPNCLTMRADLNGDGMDQGHFVFAPYARTAVCVCLTSAVADFAVKYHLRAVTIPGRIHPLNAYTRFAWGIFRASQKLLSEFSAASGTATVKVPMELVRGKRGAKRKLNEDGPDEGDDELRNRPTDPNDSEANTDADTVLKPPSKPPFDLCTLSTRDFEAAERLDDDLNSRPVEPYEVAAGVYKGYSRSLRAIFEYRQAHPEVSAVRTARVARVGEDFDEQLV